MEEKLSLESIRQMFSPELIVVNPPVSSSTELLELMGKLVQDKGYAQETFTAATIKREETYPTGLSTEYIHVAVPHTDVCHVIKQSVAVAKLQKPIPFAAMGLVDEIIPVEYVFLLLFKNDGTQIILLQKLMNMCSDLEFTNKLKAAQNAQEIYLIIQEYYQKL